MYIYLEKYLLLLLLLLGVGFLFDVSIWCFKVFSFVFLVMLVTKKAFLWFACIIISSLLIWGWMTVLVLCVQHLQRLMSLTEIKNKI